MTARADRIRSADLAYQWLVERASEEVSLNGSVDLETAIVADELGYSINTLTADAEFVLGLHPSERKLNYDTTED